MNTKNISYLLLILWIFVIGCKDENHVGPKQDTINEPFDSSQVDKIVVNAYVENSGSMDGYVMGVTEFEQAVYSYLSDIKISNFADSLNLYYINSRIIPRGSDISDFIEKLEPDDFRLRGGDRGTSDIANVLDSVLAETDKNEVAILVTDGIFSPGSGKDAEQYLLNQQIGIKNTMAEYLKSNQETGVIVYQLSSEFDGYFYNRENSRTNISTRRPYYIWIIGDIDHLVNLTQSVPTNKFKGSGAENVFSITSGNKEKNYAVKMGSGNFDLDKSDPKKTIENLRQDKRKGTVRFSVNADLSGFLLDDAYLLDTTNYQVSSRDIFLEVNKAVENAFGFTHQINLSSERVHKGQLSIKLKSEIPNWVEQVNDSDGLEPIENKTYGIKHQIAGIYEAFTFSDSYYTEIIINIE